jgi:signal transduction histidine kinase
VGAFINAVIFMKVEEKKISSLFRISSVLSFIVFGANDLFNVLGFTSGYMLLSFGALFGIFFLATSVNQDIEKTYSERDDLVANLQLKVNEQTSHLSEALMQVKKSQADLIQSARLASLGTLSAGIAHEINNAINFVNGAVIPLERKVTKHIPAEDKVIVDKLFEAIKQGTNLTVEIVRSLRNFTGLNQAKVKDVQIQGVVESIVTILKSKLKAIKVTLNIEAGLTMNCYQVGLNQIFMNIFSNAIDVLPAEGGEIAVSAVTQGDFVQIKISDNGSGMPPEVKDRIFDPFFTTKEVGKGTGLGLHIVLKEVEKHNGTISVSSEKGRGTEFCITLPRVLAISQGEAA